MNCEVEGFVLAGGASRRMGRAKACLVVEGETVLERVVRALRWTGRVRAVIKPESGDDVRAAAAQAKCEVVFDVKAEACALAGLHAALTASRAEWIAVAACDYPFVTAEMFARLMSLRNAESACVVPFDATGRAQTLCALYRTDVCLAAVERMFARGDLRVEDLRHQVAWQSIGYSSLANLADSTRLFFNMNTPADFARISSTSNAVRT